MPSPLETWEEAKQFESSKIVQEIGYKLEDNEIRNHIYDIHKKAPNIYSYFCKKIEKKRNQTQAKLGIDLQKIIDDFGVDEFKNNLANIKKMPAFDSKKSIELVGIEAFPHSIQQSVRAFVEDHKNSLPPKITFVPYNRYTAQYQNNDGIITAPTTDDELITKLSLNHELGHLCDKQLQIVDELGALYNTIALQYADEQYKNQKKNKAVSAWLGSLDQFHNKYKCSGSFEKIRHARELLADALATHNNEKLCKIGFIDYNKTNHPASNYSDSYSHPSLAVRAHQMATLHRYYKIEQKMCKEYGLMGYQHGNLFS